MASRRVEVAEALKLLVARALPGATVKGMVAEEAKPSRVDALGLAIVRSGDPGPPDIDLSPPAYNYEHDFPVELAAQETATHTSQQILDDMMLAIGAAIAADRMLGGLCTWLDAEAPTDGEAETGGAAAIGWAEFRIVASYTTTSPLG